MPTNRELLIDHITERMADAFTRGDFIDAQNLNAYLDSLDHMNDSEYDLMVAEAEDQAADEVAS